MWEVGYLSCPQDIFKVFAFGHMGFLDINKMQSFKSLSLLCMLDLVLKMIISLMIMVHQNCVLNKARFFEEEIYLPTLTEVFIVRVVMSLRYMSQAAPPIERDVYQDHNRKYLHKNEHS